MDNQQQRTEQPVLHQLDFFGYKIQFPDSYSLNIIILATLFIQTLNSLFKTKPVEFAVDLLRGTDLQMLEELDDLAVELREISQADRVLVVCFHNGKSSSNYHWKRMSALAEATRLGIEPVKSRLKDLDIHNVLEKVDYDNWVSLKANKQFVHTHLDLPTVTDKQKRFLINCYMFGQYVMLLMDSESGLPHGVVFVQYDNRDKCEIDNGNTVGWSDNTQITAQEKVAVINNLIYKKITSTPMKIINFVRGKLPF